MLLQSVPIPPAFSPDSLVAKHEAITETIRNTPPEELLPLLGEKALQFGLKVLAALVIYAIGAWLISLIRKAIKKSFLRRKTEPTLATFTDSLVNIALWVILIISVIGALGVNTTSLAALLAAGGMAIGMALSGTVQNFAGGIMLLIFKPFKVGDYIEALGYAGTVIELTIVSTKLRTFDNRIIILPNGALSSGNINNMNREPLRRIDIDFSTSYGTSVEQVKSAVAEILKDQPLLLDAQTPGAADPFVGLVKMSSSSVDFVLRVWVNTPDYWPCRFALTESLYDRLPSLGVSFPFPQLDVHMK